MDNFIEVEYRSGKLAYFTNPNNLDIKPDNYVIVEVERGYDIVKVVHCSVWTEEISHQHQNNKLMKIVQIAGAEEMSQLQAVIDKEKSATEKFLSLLTKYSFEMKLIETIYQFDGNKLTFFFTSDGRIDFREFVRELATAFRTRIELHQSTGRDEAKRLCGIGMCGYKYCCSSYLKKFNQVTIKMVKDQNLSGNLSKISGPCGRLLCCLNFEEDYYSEIAKEFPEVGDKIKYKGALMYVYKNDYCSKKIHLSDNDQLTEVITLEDYKDIVSGKYMEPEKPKQNSTPNNRINKNNNNRPRNNSNNKRERYKK